MSADEPGETVHLREEIITAPKRREQRIVVNADRLLEDVNDPEDREAVRRIAQRAICEEGDDDE